MLMAGCSQIYFVNPYHGAFVKEILDRSVKILTPEGFKENFQSKDPAFQEEKLKGK